MNYLDEKKLEVMKMVVDGEKSISWAAAFVFHASPIAVVWCLNADQIFKAVPAFIKCNFGHWAKKLTR